MNITIIDPGHAYRLEGGGVLQFLKKEPDPQTPDGPLIVTRPGTTNEEVLAVLIDRISRLNRQFPCRENSLAITKLEEALHWLNARTARRQAQGTEGRAAETAYPHR